MRRLLLSLTLALVAALCVTSVALAVGFPFQKATEGVGLGSTLKKWTAYGKATVESTNFCAKCYGESVYNNALQFTGHMFRNLTLFHGVVIQYDIELPNGSPYSAALHAVHHMLPSDTKFSALSINRTTPGQNCGFISGTSKSLGLRLGSWDSNGHFTVEFVGYGSSANFQPFFKHKNVQEAIVKAGKSHPGTVC